MPIYEYQCEECGKINEALQKISDKPLTKCSFCSGKLHKLISHSAFHLKGTGWYVTDYAGKKHQDSAKTDDSASSETKSSDASKAPDTSKKTSGDE